MFFSFFFHILGRIIPTDELKFFRGVETTNQPIIAWMINTKDITSMVPQVFNFEPYPDTIGMTIDLAGEHFFYIFLILDIYYIGELW